MSKISELTDGGSLLPTDFLIAVRSGGNVKVQADDITVDQIRLGDNEKIELGNNQDLQIYHDGSHSYVSDQGTGNLVLKGNNFRVYNAAEDKLMFAGNNGGISYMYYDGSVRIATSDTGAAVTGDIVLGDTNPTITMNDSSVTNLQHLITSSSDRLIIAADNNDVSAGSKIEFYVDGTKYSEVTPTGIDVTGSVTADGLTVSNLDGSIVKLESTGTGLGAGAVIGDLQFYGNDASTPGAGIKASITATTVAALGDDSQLMFSTSNGTTNNVNRMLLANNGDISFYSSDGLSQALFWDASAESLGIGTSSPDHILCLEDAEPTLRIFDAVNTLNQEQTIAFGTEPGDRTHAEIAGINTNTGNAAGALSFKTNAGSSVTERMRIDASGQVQIGASAISSSQTSALLSVRKAGPSIEFGHNNAAGYGSTIGANASNGNPYVAFSAEPATTTLNAFRTRGLKGTVIAGGASGEITFNRVPLATADNQVPVESMRIDASGHAIIPAGVTLGTAVGVYAAANTLHDYEEGTWTVTLHDAVTGGNASPTTQTGYYTKIGNQVTAYFRFINDIDTTGMTAGNNMYVSLPFASGSEGSASGGLVLDRVTYPTGYTQVNSYVPVSVSRGSLRMSGSGVGDTDVDVGDFNGTNSDIQSFTLTYFV